jgi:DNA-3-methyladenine glycosylase II
MDHPRIKHHFRTVDPLIYSVMADLNFNDWIQPRNPDDYFISLCRDIIAQQLSDKASDTITQRFAKLFPKNHVTPQSVLDQPDQKLRGVGMSWAKVRYVKNLAEKVLSQELILEQLPDLSDRQVIQTLTTIKGIGVWTAEMFLIFSLARADVFSHSDQGLKRAIANLYQLTSPTEKQISRIVDPWSPYKSYGSVALWHSLSSNK